MVSRTSESGRSSAARCLSLAAVVVSASAKAISVSNTTTMWPQCPAQLQGLSRELGLLRTRWHIILACLLFQYVHGIFTQLAYRMHRPGHLHDLGFEVIPELPTQWRWLSEALFTGLFVSFVLWTFVPLFLPRTFSCVVVWTRLLTVLVVCQSLRIVSFTSTQLPGPAPHCRPGALTAHRSPAAHWWQHVVVDVRRQVGNSCGDLIFSSHMTFILMGVLSYQHYGGRRIIKVLAWTAAAVLALLIISARKHYTVDVVIAWYAVPLAYCCLNMYWNQLQQRQRQSSAANGAAGVFSHPSYSAVLDTSCCGVERCSCSSTSAWPIKLSCKTGIRQSEQLSEGADGDAVIDFGSSTAWKSEVPFSLSARTPTAVDPAASADIVRWPSPSRVGAVWQHGIIGHRGSGSSSSSVSSTSSLLSRDSGSPYGYAASGRLRSDDSSDA